MSLATVITDTSKKLRTVLEDFHTTNFPTLEINTPGRFITDVESMLDPFLVIEINYNPVGIGMPKKHCINVSGMLTINHYAKTNSGEFVFTEYTGKLLDSISLETLEGIAFHEVKPYPDSGKPGFDGVMNVIKFDIDYFNI